MSREINQYSQRKFDGKSFGYYSGSYSKEVAERVKRKLMTTGTQVRITKGREPLRNEIVNFYRIWVR
jgi:uncharacterized protein YwgA